MKIRALLVQGFASLIIAYLVSLSGFVYAWPSYTVANFTSNTTVLSWPMSAMEVSLLGSLTNIGSLLATPACGYVLNTFGRKYSAMLFGVPTVLAWITISLTTNVPLVIASVGFAGIGAAGQAVSAVYISEIVDDSIRGAMTSILVSGYYLGLLMSYILGGHLSHYQVVYVHLLLSVLYIVLLIPLKESPVFLMKNGKEEEAARSIAFYKQMDVKSKEVEVELKKIKMLLDPRLEKILQGEKDLAATKELLGAKPGESLEVSESEWKFLRKSPSSMRALVVCLNIMALSIFMGAIVLQVYAEPLFKEAVPSMEPNQCSILLAVDLLVASLLCGIFVDKLGRKSLMIITAVGTGLLTFLLGTQLQLHWAPHWFTAVLIYTYCFVYNLGSAVIPFVIAAEVFLPEVRGLCNSLVTACMWIMNFVTLVIFTSLVDILGLGPIFYGFSIVCFTCAVYCHFYLPETKSLPVDAIQVLFLKKKPLKA